MPRAGRQRSLSPLTALTDGERGTGRGEFLKPPRASAKRSLPLLTAFVASAGVTGQLLRQRRWSQRRPMRTKLSTAHTSEKQDGLRNAGGKQTLSTKKRDVRTLVELV